MKLTKDTPIMSLTLGQFEDWVNSMGFVSSTKQNDANEKNWVYGVHGVMSLFGCSYGMALRRIHGVLAPACVWIGPRKLQVDADLAIELMKQQH